MIVSESLSVSHIIAPLEVASKKNISITIMNLPKRYLSWLKKQE